MRALRVQLLATYLALSLLPLGLLGWAMLGSLDRFYQQRLLDDLQSEAGLIGEAITTDVRDGQMVTAAALMTNPPSPLRTQARVLVFDGSGQLVAASGEQVAPVTDEPGLSAALGGVVARGVEYSPALDTPIAFVAVPLMVDDRVIGVVHLAYALADLQNELSGLRLGVWLAMAGLGALAVMVSLEFSRRMNRPLDRLRAATHDLAAGHFHHRVTEDGPTELAEVARNFNRMASELERVEQQRQTLFANLAHDIRTPLGSIRAAAEALEAGAHEQPELRERLTTGLIVQIGYLRRLTDDLLRLATYEGGEVALRLQAVSPESLLRQAAEAIAPAAGDQAVTITVQPEPALPAVFADPDRVLEILLNLLDNALRYTPRDGRITLWAQREPSSARVSFHVWDTGPGLPPGEEASLFERHRSGTTRRAGSGLNAGLGLSIARALVTRHGGVIHARTHPGGGAELVFTLPAAQENLR